MKKEATYDKVKNMMNIKDYKEQFFNEFFPNLQKRFRHKKRYSFITKDKLFRFDCTIVKQSSGTSILDSDLFNQTKQYELELEYIGPRFKSEMTTSQKQKQVETIVQNLKINIGYILQVIQDSFWVISNSETKLVREVFQSCLQKIY